MREKKTLLRIIIINAHFHNHFIYLFIFLICRLLKDHKDLNIIVDLGVLGFLMCFLLYSFFHHIFEYLLFKRKRQRQTHTHKPTNPQNWLKTHHGVHHHHRIFAYFII